MLLLSKPEPTLVPTNAPIAVEAAVIGIIPFIPKGLLPPFTMPVLAPIFDPAIAPIPVDFT
ncbi:hypothetical protein [Vagococcus fluvialis]|uniref:hypothetical protein n=1 Tax=Vagococcus fluvialis TaxID=2738 RepID=UPI003B5A4964